MPEIESGDDKELISFALFVLNVLCDVIHDFMTSDVNAFTSDGLIGQSNSFGNDWLQLLQRRANIVINVLGTVDMLQKFSVCAWYTRCRQRHETVHFFMHHPVITTTRQLDSRPAAQVS